MTLSTASSIPEPALGEPQSEKIWSVGTLRYNQRQLIVVFFWLMWNDFSFKLIESIGSLGNFLILDQGGTYTQIALFGTIGGLITPWLNPWVSTWSDRHRGKMGRRRPFLFFSVPLFAVFLAITPYMPTLYHYLLRYPWMVTASAHFPMKGQVFFIGINVIISGIFNAVFLAIFSYLYFDVVPEALLGRFNALNANVGLIAGLVWSFWIFGLADHHMKAVYVGTALFSLTVYLLSVWKIKEGEYPPPDKHTKGGVFAPIRAYFVECFSDGYYLWVFVALFFAQVGNKGNDYQQYYLHYDLKLDLATIGWASGWTQAITFGFGILCGFIVGMMTDKLKPVRLMAGIYLVEALAEWGSFFFVHDKWTWLISFSVVSLIRFVLGVVFSAFVVQIFPREKLGQFCSAQAVFYQFPLVFLTIFIAKYFDFVHNNRVSFLWDAIFYFIAALAYAKVHLNWNRKHGRTPVPHAG